MDCYMGMIIPVAFNYAPSDFLECNGVVLNMAQYAAVYSLLGTYYGGDGRSTFGLPDLRGRQMLGYGTYQNTGPSYQMGVTGGQPPQNGLLVGTTPISVNNLPPHTHTAAFAATSGSVPVTIPATTGSGSITATASIAAVPGIDSHAVTSPVASSSYYLTGAQTPGKPPVAVQGPFTPTAPAAGAAATINGTTVTVNTSAYVPPTPQQTVNVTAVTGGAVTNANTGGGQALVTTMQPPPTQVVNFIICMVGLYPSRP